MKHVIAIIIATFFVTFSSRQTAFKKNTVYIEAGGNVLFASANYQRQLAKQPGLGIRVGSGFYSENAFYLTVPVGVDYLFKLNNDKSFIDAGLGATWTRNNDNLFVDSKNTNGDHFVNFVPSIGYRRHTNENLMWRISLAPIANKLGLYLG